VGATCVDICIDRCKYECQPEVMLEPTPAVLLGHPELVRPVAPWCSWLENHELGILLLAQPWLAGKGLRRAELQEQLERLAADLPIGPVYFQRVSRSAAALEARGQLAQLGKGRTRRFQTTVGGLAALILNLQVLRSDPTVDGSEFELKRALVALWNMVAVHIADVSDEVESGPALSGLLRDLSCLKVWQRAVITDQVVEGGFDILRLIRTQRDLLARFEEEARRRQSAVAARSGLVEPMAPRATGRGRRPGSRTRRSPGVAEALATAQLVATGVAPRLECEAALLRYRAYAGYLDGLETLYARELPVVDLAAVRRAGGGR
jgi:hypothetical protein